MFIGASPDGNVIKTLPQLKLTWRLVTSKGVTSTMYSQIITQMVVMGRKWCDLFIYTRHRYHQERIFYDEATWNIILLASVKFFFTYMAPALVKK